MIPSVKINMSVNVPVFQTGVSIRKTIPGFVVMCGYYTKEKASALPMSILCLF